MTVAYDMDGECRRVVDHNNLLMTRLTRMFERVLGGDGEHLHWGYFVEPQLSFRQAQDALVDHLAAAGRVTRESRVLDVGCGVGGPAIYLHERTGCSVMGVTNNELGVQRARQHARTRGCDDRVKFHLADGLDNGLPDASFDAVLMIESAYMIPDKTRLFAENWRVLAPGGSLAVCDNMRGRAMKFGEMIRYRREIQALKNIFGEGWYVTLEEHAAIAERVGFGRVRTEDFNNRVLPTIEHLLAMLEADARDLAAEFTQEVIDDVATSFIYTRTLCDLGISTYGMLVAEK